MKQPWIAEMKIISFFVSDDKQEGEIVEDTLPLTYQEVDTHANNRANNKK